MSALYRRVDRGAELLLESLAIRHNLADKGGIAQCLESLAALAGTRRQSGRAARLFGAAASIREGMGSHLSPAERPVYERDLAQARALTDEATFAAVWAAGHALTVEEAVVYAQGSTEA